MTKLTAIVCRLRSKRTVVVVACLFGALNVVYFAYRTLLSDGCNASSIVRERRLALDALEFVNAPRSCQFAEDRGVNVSTPATNWCMYRDDVVDLRLIILAFNRHASLLRLLSSLSELELDGDSAAVEIWIDRAAETQDVDEQTLAAARSFQWRHGRVRVHVHRQHVGVYGQWLATWRPRAPSTGETALLIEDDVSVSPFAYRWLRAARRFYASMRDIAGLTLQSEGLIVATGGEAFQPPTASVGAAYLYALMGSWGFAPRPDVWMDFQDWYAAAERRTRPTVPGLIMSDWYSDFERQGKADTMWTMWFIYYCAVVRDRQLFTVFNNLDSVAAADPAWTGGTFLAVNRREPGMHYEGQPVDNVRQLARTWKTAFSRFSRTPATFNFSGHQIDIDESLSTLV